MSKLNERVILSENPDRIKKDRAVADFKLLSQYLTGGNKNSHKSPQPFYSLIQTILKPGTSCNLIFHAGIWNTRNQIINSEEKI